MNDKIWKVLVVDDEADVHDVTTMALRRLKYENIGIKLIHAFSANEAIGKLIEYPDISVALVDVVMETDTAGLKLVRMIREDMKNDNIRIILRTGNPGVAPEDEVTLTYDINDYRGKVELTAQSLRTTVITALRSYQSIVTIKGLNKEIEETQKELIFTLGEIAESRSTETGNHVERVSIISAFLAEKLGFSHQEISHIKLAASMHDLGKLAIEDRVLNKPGKLTKDEFNIIKKHTTYGREILGSSDRELLKLAAIIAHEHHENVDGSGYPNGLKQDEIHLVSRIVALVDVYDALSIKRVYKEPWPRNKIYDYIREQTNIKFDAKVVEVFFKHQDEIDAISDSLLTTEC